jgi:hypothetical protein
MAPVEVTSRERRLKDAFGQLKLRERSMNQTDGSGSLANGGGYPLNTSSADIAHCEDSWQAALQHQRGSRKRPCRIPIWVRRKGQSTPAKDEAFLIESNTSLKPIRVRGSAGHNEEVMYLGRAHLPGSLIDPAYFFEIAFARKIGQFGVAQ